MNRGDYTGINEYYYYGECVPVINTECVTLRLFDSFGDGGTIYIVSWDRNVIKDDKQDSNSNPEIAMGICDELFNGDPP